MPAAGQGWRRRRRGRNWGGHIVWVHAVDPAAGTVTIRVHIDGMSGEPVLETVAATEFDGYHYTFVCHPAG